MLSQLVLLLSYLSISSSQSQGATKIIGNPLIKGAIWTNTKGAAVVLKKYNLPHGTATAFNVFIVKPNIPIYFQIWRPTNDEYKYRLAGSQRVVPTATGTQTIQINDMGVENGDKIGFAQMSEEGVIAYQAADRAADFGGPGDDAWTLEFGSTNNLPEVWKTYTFTPWNKILRFSVSVTVNTKRLPGEKGLPGPTGPVGKTGLPGLQGPPGRGPKGFLGPKGPNGVRGVDAGQGAPGSSGDYGVKGVRGTSGDPGFNGKKGLSGRNGVDGSQGFQGMVGPKGIRGNSGMPGNLGPSQGGLKGIRGDIGELGERGLNGEQGQEGTMPSSEPYTDYCTKDCHKCVDGDVGKTCVCSPGFILSANRTACIDKRCDSLYHNSGCSQICKRSGAEGFTCSCNDGYSMALDGKTCRISTSCSKSMCGKYQQCLNTPHGIDCYGPKDPEPTSEALLEAKLEFFKRYEVFIGLLIWLIVITISSLVVLILILYRIHQVRDDIKVHLMVVNKQMSEIDAIYQPKYIAATPIMTETNI